MKKMAFIIFIFFIGVLKCNALSSEKYYKTILENGEYISEEITKKEYENVDYVDLLSTSIETEYKMMSITTINNKINLTVSWKKSPKYKSYDVIALTFNGCGFNANDVFGEQKAIFNNNTELSRYSASSQNTVILSNGIGISMNLMNDALSYTLTLKIPYSGHGTIYGNYRHAQSNVTLSQSQNYYLNSNGNIIFNLTSTNDKFDTISPVWIDV